MTRPAPPTDDPDLARNWARVQEMHERYDREVGYALKSQSHLWGVMSLYQLDEAEVLRMVAADKAGELRRSAVPESDPDRLLSVTVGCFICEQPLDARLLSRRCPGEPK